MRRISVVAVLAVMMSLLAQPAQAVGALPSAVREVTVSGRAASQVTLSWLAPASEGLTPIESYNIYSKPTTDPLWSLSQSVLAGTTTATVSGLQAGVNYQFRVTALNAAGEGAAGSYGELLDAALGSNFSCAIRGNGSVWCWGANDIGQFGSGDGVSSPSPVQIAGLAGSQAITAGPNFACALKAGAVWCFGDNTFGQLGDGSTTSSLSPVAVVGIPEAVASLDAGARAVCAVTVSGAMYCWGDNADALLGNGGNVSSPTAALIQVGVSEVSVGVLHACALMIGGIVTCWGSESLTPTEITSVPNALQVSVGGVFDQHGDMCAVTSTREVSCWSSITSPVVPVSGPSSVVQLSVGLLHACALTDTGSAWCWGTNNDGELGNPNRLAGTYIASGVPSLSRVIVGGDSFSGYTCGATPNGGLYCWGANAFGQIGNGTYTTSVLPSQLAGFSIQSAGAAIAPTAVSGVTFVSRTESSIALSWNALTSAEADGIALDSYLIETSLDGAIWSSTSVPGSQLSVTVTGLLPASNYLVRVSGVTAAGQGTPSESVSMRTSLTPDAVSGLAFVSRSGSTLSVAWTEPAADGLPILSYKVEWQTGIGAWQSATVVGATSYTISTLAAATSYRIRVSATSAAGTGLPSAELTDRTSNPPDVVTGLAHVARTESSISVSWDTPAADGLPIVTYEVQWFLGAATEPTRKFVAAPTTSTTITGLTGATAYRIRVAAVSSAGTGPASAELVDRTLNAPAAVTGITNTGRTGTSISLSWNAPDTDSLSILDYKVEWSTAGGSWSSKVVASTSTTIDGLLGNTDYVIRVSARSAAGLGPTSTEWADHTLRAPSKITGITHVGRTESSIEVSWTTPASDGLPLTSIKLEWSRDGVNWPSRTLTGVQAALTRWNITSLQSASNYQIRITATSSAGTGLVSDLFSDRTAHEPAQVLGLSFVSRTAKSISLSWTRPDSDGLAITGYKIEASTDGITWSSQLIAGEVTSGTIAGLATATDYRLRVRATNAAGTGPVSAELLDRTSRAPAAVAAVSVSARTSTSLSINWSAPADDGSPIKYYLVEYSENGLAWNSFSVQNSSALLTNLLAASSYYVRVVAVSDAGQSPASPSQVVSTLGSRSGAITVSDSAGRPVVGGTVTWRIADTSEASTGTITLNSLGQFEIVGVAPGQLIFTVANAELVDGTRVSGEFSLWFGFSTAKVELPAAPATAAWTIKVKLPSGRPVVGAKVVATGLGSSVVRDGVTFSTSAVTASGVTDSLGVVSLNGFAGASPSISVSYFDGLKKVTADTALTTAETVVTLADATWVKSAFNTKTVTVGQKVEVVVSSLTSAGPRAGIAVKILAPKGAKQTGCGAVLKGTTNAAGKAKLYVCATKSGQYKLSAVGAVVTSTVTLLVNGTAPMPVTRLTVRSLEARIITIGWLAPQFNGGSKVTEYRVTVTGSGKVIRRVLTGSNLTLRGLTSGATYQVDVLAKNLNGLSEVVSTTVTVV